MKFLSTFSKKSKLLAVLVDPDKCEEIQLGNLTRQARKGHIHLFLVGGSLLLKNKTQETIQYLKDNSAVPVIIFPGSPAQVCHLADGILFLSLISGRNPDLLIGRHIEAAPILKQSGIEVIATGYMLIDGGKGTSVSYISNTTPIPSDKADIAVATAMAGELLGLKTIYLEAGSGALYPVSKEIIEQVSNAVEIPVIVGGGIKTPEQIKDAFDAGANMVVLGTALEKNPDWVEAFSTIL